jgi:hypothetical protein
LNTQKSKKIPSRFTDGLFLLNIALLNPHLNVFMSTLEEETAKAAKLQKIVENYLEKKPTCGGTKACST